MPFNVLLLPLLGGYIFISYWNRTKYSARRYSGERFIFHAAIVGVILLLISLLLTRSVMWLCPDLASWGRSTVPFAYSGTSLGAFLIGAIAWKPLNELWYPPDREIYRAIEKWDDYLEILLTHAVRQTKQIAVTLKSRKVYAGLVTRGIDPLNDRKYIRMIPTQSGYRDEGTLDLAFTTNQCCGLR
jgi:hypothetical protein